MANVILPNGARLYVDHAHPEYSSPEVTNPLDARALGQGRRAGDARGRAPGRRRCPASTRRSTCTRTTPTTRAPPTARTRTTCAAGRHRSPTLVRHLVAVLRDPADHLRRRTGRASGRTAAARVPDLPARRLLRGRGRPGDHAEAADRQHPGRAARRRRPIPASARDHRRRQPVRDLDLLEARHHRARARDDRGELPGRRPGDRDPGTASCTGSRTTLGCGTGSPSRGGRTITALDMQGEYLERAHKFVDDRYGSDADEQTRDVLARWESVLTRLAADPMQLAGELDWVAKLRLLEGFRDRDGLAWDAPRLQLVDLQYADLRPEKGLYHRLVSRGSMATLLPDGAADAAVDAPPDGHPRVLPRRVPTPVRTADRRRVVGLGDLRRRARVAGPGADAGTPAGNSGARRRVARPLRRRRGSRRRARRPALGGTGEPSRLPCYVRA